MTAITPCPEHGVVPEGGDQLPFQADCTGCELEYTQAQKQLADLVGKLNPLMENAAQRGVDVQGLMNTLRLEALIEAIIPSNDRNRFGFEMHTANGVGEQITTIMENVRRNDILKGVSGMNNSKGGIHIVRGKNPKRK